MLVSIKSILPTFFPSDAGHQHCGYIGAPQRTTPTPKTKIIPSKIPFSNKFFPVNVDSCNGHQKSQHKCLMPVKKLSKLDSYLLYVLFPGESKQ